MKIKNDKLKVYEFLFKRIDFNPKELEEYMHLKRMDVLEAEFHEYLKKINKTNIELYWHLTLPIHNKKEVIEIMIVTAYSIHLFKILDLTGGYEINPFNILLKNDEPVLDLNIKDAYYAAMKDTIIEEEGFIKPIFFNYVVLDDTFSVSGYTNVPFLTRRTLTTYLNKIEATSFRKKHKAPF